VLLLLGDPRVTVEIDRDALVEKLKVKANQKAPSRTPAYNLDQYLWQRHYDQQARFW